jgi:hypothetical protein
MRALRWTIVAVAIMAAAVSPPAHAANTRIEGGWIGPIPCAFTNFDPTTGHFECEGSTLWDGALTGIARYHADGTFDLATGDGSGTVAETFYGIATADRSSGTLAFNETFTIDGATNAIHIVADIIEGSGDWVGSSGQLTFVGVQFSGVAGHGGYSGTWVRP